VRVTAVPCGDLDGAGARAQWRAHLFALPNKIGLSRQEYLVAQSIYRGWSLFGIVIFAGIAAKYNFLLALMLWHRA
jgi:hypothetical protein